MKMRRAAMAGITALLLTVSSPSTASAETVTSVTPLAGTGVNPCTGDLITYQGSLHTKAHAAIDLEGREHVSLELNTQDLHGLTPAGIRYVLLENRVISLNYTFDPPTFAPAEANVVLIHHLVRQGEVDPPLVLEDDFYLMVLAHITINAKGVVTVNRLDVKLECR
jgi:hypothetical protein